MSEIRCPHCGEVFQIDESNYAAIVQQVRNAEFDRDIREKLLHAEHEKETAVSMAVMEAKESFRDTLRQKEQAIAALETKLAATEAGKEAAISSAVSEQRDALRERDEQIADLKLALASAELKQKADEQEAKHASEALRLKAELEASSLRDSYEERLRMKDEQIAYYRDFKARQSTKMVGESLEQHCFAEFEKVRSLGFAGAYFDKDNDARSGSKGDFIFRDFDEDGEEYVSIMFEMKNEMDGTEKKHKNSDFFKELDKDRREKNCEYAVLVSLLESESELYNQGIVDVSHLYPKMYVIRPQFFIPLLTLLRNAAQNNLATRQELARTRAMNADFVQLEANVDDFKQKFGRNYELASRRFNEAIDEIDKTITHLQKVRDALTSSERNYRLANDKAQALSVPVLTKGCSKDFGKS